MTVSKKGMLMLLCLSMSNVDLSADLKNASNLVDLLTCPEYDLTTKQSQPGTFYTHGTEKAAFLQQPTFSSAQVACTGVSATWSKYKWIVPSHMGSLHNSSL